MAVELSISIKQNSQNVANNTSNVTVSVIASWTNGSYNRTEKSGWLKLDGTTYTFTSPFNYYATASGSETIYTKTVDVSHDSNGAKTVSCLASYTTGVSSGTITASASKTLTTISGASTVSVLPGTLGTSQTITVSRKSSSFTHSIKAVCGSSTIYIKADGSTSTSEVKHSDCSIPFTPPISWASQNTKGLSVSIRFTITTYSGNTKVGSAHSVTVSFAIPETVRPSCTVTVTDPTGNADKYGSFVKGISKLKVEVKATPSQGAPITSYRVTANGATYNTASFTTGEITTAGSQKISATVTDSRTRHGTGEQPITVLEYSPPIINRLAVKRCDADGKENDQGKSIQVSVSATITKLNNLNETVYILKYKKTSENTYTPITLLDSKVEGATANYSFSGSEIFAADPDSSYDIEFVATDSHNSSHRTTSASTAFTLMNWNAKGNGIAFGKVSELENVFDVGFRTRLLGGLEHPVLEPETDLDHVLIPNTYIGDNVSTYNYANCPVESGTFTLIVEGCGESGQIRQTYVNCSKVKPQKFVRFYYLSAWGPWMFSTTDEIVLYENASGSRDTISLTYWDGTKWLTADTANYRYLEIYYTDNNDKSGGYTKIWNPSGKTVTLQLQEAGSTIFNRQTVYTIGSASITPNLTTAGYVQFKSDGTLSVISGDNFIKIVRVIGLA